MSGLVARTYGEDKGIASPSYVTDGAEIITNPGSAIAAGLANRCLRIVNQVVQTL